MAALHSSASTRIACFVAACVAAACGLSHEGTGDASGNSGDAAADGSMTGPTDAASPTSSVDGESATDGPCSPAACPGQRCVNGACGAFATCKDLHDNGPTGEKSGVYEFASTASGTFSAYCEMTLAGGGWTLVGQSGSGATTMFGWHAATGSVTVESVAYSLDAIKYDVGMSEALLATGTRGAIIAAYTVSTPLAFPTGYDLLAGPDSKLTRLQNPSCTTAGAAPNMLTNMGFTALTNGFFFRDGLVSGPYGLLPTSWDTFYDDCTNGGKLKGQSGMLFTR